MGRNVFSGPGLFGLTVSIIRRIQIRERYALQLRADSLNVTGTLSSGTGVNGTGGGRVVTGGVKLTF